MVLKNLCILREHHGYNHFARVAAGEEPPLLHATKLGDKPAVADHNLVL